MKLCEFCITNITFKFVKFCYNKINNVAMKSLLTPALAEVFLTKVENYFINYTSNLLKVLFYNLFVNDIFVILPKDENKNKFVNKFNTVNKTL